MTRVRTGSRLHFGLMRLPPGGAWPKPGAVLERYFGGVGMMIEEPKVVVSAEPADHWSFTGLLADRVRGFAAMIGGSPHRLQLQSCPPEHTGLGVGTQLGLAVGAALTKGTLSVTELARRLGRGQRSAVGVNGFSRGGLLVDAGKLLPDEISHVTARVEVPLSWWVVLVTPRVETRWSGSEEQAAFAAVDQWGRGDDFMGPIIETGILPAARSVDLKAFGAAVGEYNARAGELFRPTQGGRYAHPAVRSAVATLTALGFVGAGQTSWGPTVFAFTDDADRAKLADAALAARGLPPVTLTAARNRGAEVDG